MTVILFFAEIHAQTKHEVHNFGRNLTYVQNVFKNAPNWPKQNSQHGSNFMDGDSYVFMANFLHSIPNFICFAYWWTYWAFVIFNTGNTDFELGKTIINLCSSHCLLFTGHFHQFRSFWRIFPKLKAKSDATMLFFQVCQPFSRYDKTVNRTAHTCT